MKDGPGKLRERVEDAARRCTPRPRRANRKREIIYDRPIARSRRRRRRPGQVSPYSSPFLGGIAKILAPTYMVARVL